jgi:phenylacetic acid degradation operon negative regulatory protein
MVEAPPRQLILSLYGLYAREEGDWLSVASLIELMADLGIDSAAVRSSVSRLKRRGVLEASRRSGQAGYALSANSLEVLREGDQRIWHRPRATADDGWLLLVFSVPESERVRRHELRTLLAGLGFGTVAPGVWVAPATLYCEARDALSRAGLSTYTELFRGAHLGDVSARLGEWWDLEALTALYASFCTTWRPAFRRRIQLPPADAFAAYVPMLTAWRRLPYLDPGLPLEHLPHDWPGIEAGEIFTSLDARLRDDAHTHAVAVVHQ